MKKPEIVMLGSNLKDKGGIVSVVSTLLNSQLISNYKINYIVEYQNTKNLLKILFIFLKAFFKLSFILISKPQIRIVHTHVSIKGSFYRNFFFFLLAKIFSKKFIFHLHGGKFKKFYFISNKLIKSLIKTILSNSDLVIVLSKNWKHYILSIVPNPSIKILYNPIQTKDYIAKRNSSKKSINILFMGLIGKRKGAFDLLDSAKIILKKYPTAKFIIAGDGEIEKLKQKSKILGISKNIEIPGWISGKEKFDLFKNSDIYVLPSYVENLPVSIIEAMASGLPIVSTKVGGIPDIIKEGINGYLIKPGDINTLTSKIDILIKSGSLRKKIGKNNIIKSKEFDINRISNILSNYYNELI